MIISKYHKIIFVIYTFVCFYGANWVAHFILPKWIDIMIGFPLSLFLIYKGAVFILMRK